MKCLQRAKQVSNKNETGICRFTNVHQSCYIVTCGILNYNSLSLAQSPKIIKTKITLCNFLHVLEKEQALNLTDSGLDPSAVRLQSRNQITNADTNEHGAT